MGDDGRELPPYSSGETAFLDNRGAKRGVIGAENLDCPLLSSVVKRWHFLSIADRESILTFVENATAQEVH